MTVVVNTQSEQEEKVLLAFLNSLKYEYHTDNIVEQQSLSDAQAEEILSRDEKFTNGETSAKPWNEIRKDFTSVYR